MHLHVSKRRDVDCWDLSFDGGDRNSFGLTGGIILLGNIETVGVVEPRNRGTSPAKASADNDFGSSELEL